MISTNFNFFFTVFGFFVYFFMFSVFSWILYSFLFGFLYVFKNFVFLVVYRSGNDGTADPPPFTIREFSVLTRFKNKIRESERLPRSELNFRPSDKGLNWSAR